MSQAFTSSSHGTRKLHAPASKLTDNLNHPAFNLTTQYFHHSWIERWPYENLVLRMGQQHTAYLVPRFSARIRRERSLGLQCAYLDLWI